MNADREDACAEAVVLEILAAAAVLRDEDAHVGDSGAPRRRENIFQMFEIALCTT